MSRIQTSLKHTLLASYWQVSQGISILSHSDTELKVLKPGYPYFSVSPYTGTYAWTDPEDVYHFHTPGEVEYRVEISGTGGIRQWLADDKVLLDPSPKKDNLEPYPAQDGFYVLSPETGQITHTILTMPGYFARSWTGAVPLKPTHDTLLHNTHYTWEDPKSNEDGILL